MSTHSSLLGYHYFPDDRHYTARDLDTWAPILEDCQAQWVTLQGQTSFAIPERFIRGIIDAGMKPILHLLGDIGTVKVQDLFPLFRSYASWGVRHVVLYDRPNLRKRWTGHTWSRDRLVERFLDRIIPFLKLQSEFGMQPLFPPLEPGGDYWDTAFLRSALVSLARRGEDTLLESLAVTGYAWTYGHSLSWGAGGPGRWPESRPYHTPEVSQDQIGFRVFDWYEDVSAEILGEPLPMLIIAGGPTDSRGRQDVNQEMCVEQVRGILRSILQGSLPESVRAFCFYPFVVDHTDPARSQAWFSERGKISKIGSAAQQILELPPLPSSGAENKSIKHYLLLPDDFDHEHWNAIGTFAQNNKVTVGFSIQEALRADRVTILFSDVINRDIQGDLLQAGCTIEWMIPKGDSYTLQPSAPNAVSAQVDDGSKSEGAVNG